MKPTSTSRAFRGAWSASNPKHPERDAGKRRARKNQEPDRPRPVYGPWSPCLRGHALVRRHRGAVYPHPLDDYTTVTRCFRRLMYVKYGIWLPLEAEDGAKFMQLVKMTRECHHPQIDNIDDHAGYVECEALIIQERARRKSIHLRTK